MNNRVKLLISVLFIAAIVLTIGLTRFYFDVTKNNSKVSSDEKVESIVRSYGDRHVFRNAGGMCGVVGEDGAVLIEPEWLEVLDVTSDIVLVSRRRKTEVLIGGVDYEENVVLPFVYKSFEPLTNGLYAATVAADDMVILYDADYRMFLPSAYDSAAFENNTLSVRADGCEFGYTIADGTAKLVSASLQCAVGTEKLSWRVSNRVYLSELTEADLRRMNRSIQLYTSMLIDDDFTALSEISSPEYSSALSRPGSMPDAKFERVGSFSLSREDSDSYHLAFTALYHVEDDATQAVQMQLSFRRGADNDMILSSAALNFQGAEQPGAADVE